MILLSGGMSIKLALVSVPPGIDAGSQQARGLVAALCPVGTQLTADEDDLGASAPGAVPTEGAGSTIRGLASRVVAEAFCGDGTVSIQDALVASGLGTVERESCRHSEFATRAWAADACGGRR